MRIFFIGMPGSGKSYWSKVLSSRLKYSRLDLDNYIEIQEGNTIPGMFAISETFFRDIESKTLKSLPQHFQENIIIATGGGVPFHHNNMQWMKENGIVIYLKASVEHLFKRLKNAYAVRPLLKSNSDAEMFEKTATLFEQRKETYEQAHYIIDVETATLDTFTTILGL